MIPVQIVIRKDIIYTQNKSVRDTNIRAEFNNFADVENTSFISTFS
jgi:hypothetical protein